MPKRTKKAHRHKFIVREVADDPLRRLLGERAKWCKVPGCGLVEPIRKR
jgi:hypothetical protein